jgi:hypothetical protein
MASYFVVFNPMLISIVVLNYNTFTPPTYFNLILDETDSVFTTEDQQYAFITEN